MPSDRGLGRSAAEHHTELQRVNLYEVARLLRMTWRPATPQVSSLVAWYHSVYVHLLLRREFGCVVLAL